VSDKQINSKNKDTKNKEINNKKNKSTKSTWYIWGIKIFVLSFILTIFFSFFTEIIISSSTLVVCVIVLLFLLLINIICDILATAVTSCQINPFLAMASSKIKGAKMAVYMCKNSHKFASICADVVGDICGIISGSAGAALVLIIMSNSNNTKNVVYSIIISSIIAAFTVGGKAFGKTFAIKNNQNIVFFFAKIFAFFCKEK
jgi:CBS domain containing-hemolysin-like protein